jgi:hypothetical protein
VPDPPLCRRSPGRSLRSLPPFGVRHGWSLQEAPKGIVASPLDGDTPTLRLARAPASGLTNGAAAPHLPLGLSRACVFFSRGGGRTNELGFQRVWQVNGFDRPTFIGSRQIEMNGARFMDQLVAQVRGRKGGPGLR